MAFFTPIVTINETPPESSPKTPKVKKIKIKIEGNEEGVISGEIVKPKRGRPKKDKVPDVEDPSWCNTSPKKKKKTKKRRSKSSDSEESPKRKSKRNKVEITPYEEVDTKPIIIKQEPKDEHEIIEIKKEIKEEPTDAIELPVILPLSDEDFKALMPHDQEEQKKFKCPICEKEKQDETERFPKELKKHYKELHPGKRLRQSRFSNEVHPCDVCGKEFRTNSAVKDHIETHNNYFYCEVCNASQKKILDHIIHLRIHSEEGVFICLMCDFRTEEINQITEHMNNHEDTLKYWCEACKKGFQILPWFQEHDNYHTGLKPFDCEFCGKCFLYSRYLHAHKINMHKEDMSCPSLHECVICKKQYQHKNSLKLHMNSHTGNFSICDICGKMLSSKEKLKFHIRIHTGYKPYSCSYCEKSFTKKPILVEHTRIHTGERPYICEYCTKAFSQRSSLVIHMRGHTGERPYACQFCTKAFVAKAMLNIHLKSCKGILVRHDDY